MSYNENFRKNFGKRLAYIRKCKCLTQEQLSELAEIDVGYISQIECGIGNLTIDRIAELTRALNVDPRELFTFFMIK